LTQDDGRTAIWFSANGLDWTQRGSLVSAPFGTAGVFVELGTELLLSPGNSFYEGTPGAWSSSDGITWQREEFGSEVWLGDIAQGGGLTVVTGTVNNANFSSAAGVWVKAAE